MAGEKYQLDKDMFKHGVINKIYSPKTCLLIPSYINTTEVYKRNLDNKAVNYNGVYSNESVNEKYIVRIFLDVKNRNLRTYDKAIYAAAIRGEVVYMYSKLNLLNHTGITYEEAFNHRKGRYNSIENIKSILPPASMCEIIDNNKSRQICYIVIIQ